MSVQASPEKPQRLMSLDAYRGFIMLAMASAGLGFTQVVKRLQESATERGVAWDGWGKWFWESLAYQFDHVAWTGCGFWDLIQPSFMFMVGVAMPFSDSRRAQAGQSPARRFAHVMWRALMLIGLGVFLSSNGEPLTIFTFVNVLTQIGLGYVFLYLLSARSFRTQLTAAIVILVGYWAWFALVTIPPDELSPLTQAIEHLDKKHDQRVDQFTGFAAHWNKHTNATAAVDRVLLNQFPRKEEAWEGRKFWYNSGGYQTLNFVPSLATMIFGLLAGGVLRGPRTDQEKLKWLLLAGGLCFAVVLAIDTTIWPVSIPGFSWSLCPSVKRIWSPTWAVFSTGWTFWMLAAFYWSIDIRGWRAWSWPLVVVGMNSITMYCLSQLLKPWLGRTLKTHLTTLTGVGSEDSGLLFFLFSDKFVYAPIFERLAVLFLLWLVCLWLYRQKIFVRI